MRLRGPIVLLCWGRVDPNPNLPVCHRMGAISCTPLSRRRQRCQRLRPPHQWVANLPDQQRRTRVNFGSAKISDSTVAVAYVLLRLERVCMAI